MSRTLALLTGTFLCAIVLAMVSLHLKSTAHEARIADVKAQNWMARQADHESMEKMRSQIEAQHGSHLGSTPASALSSYRPTREPRRPRPL